MNGVVGLYEPNTLRKLFSWKETPEPKRKKGENQPLVPDNSFHLPDLHSGACDRIRFTMLDRVTHVFNTRLTCTMYCVYREALRN